MSTSSATSSNSPSPTWSGSETNSTGSPNATTRPGGRADARRRGRSTRLPSSRATSSARRWARCSTTGSRPIGSTGPARPPRPPHRALDNPRVYNLDALNNRQRDALIDFWELWQDELASIRILDPACGSGAFLIEAFEQLYQAYQLSNDRLEDLRGERTLFDLDRHILQNNLYGVDLNEEAVQICRLSLWIKTARRGKVLTSLDHAIRVGNSVVDDPEVHPRAFPWRSAFPEVFEKGGFDVVVGNPPYIRQEWISPYKPYLEKAYKSYHGTADLYVYFYELGMRALKPGGRLSYIVTNKWLKAAYGEPLRRFFAEDAWVESVVDFGHAKQIFEDADVFPSIVVARKPNTESAPATTRVCAIPREQLRINDLGVQIRSEGFDVERGRLSGGAWSLEPKAVVDLLAKIRERGCPLAEFAGTKPYRGVLTGLNEAFLIDTPTRDELVKADPACSEIIKPYLRGQDVKRWAPDWVGLWMITLESSGDHQWPWSDSGEQAESIFEETFPSLFSHLKPLETPLRKRQDKGRFWWELRSCAYWRLFEQPKIIYQDITWKPSFCLDTKGNFSNNTVYFLATSDRWVLAVLNSPIGWWFAWREAQHGKDEALRYFNTFLEGFPIPRPSDAQREGCDIVVARLIELTRRQQRTNHDAIDWLKVEYDVFEPNTKLKDSLNLDSDAFISEVKKLRGKKNPLSLAALKNLREEYERTIIPAQGLANEARILEARLGDLVNAAYGLTPDEVRLMWETAPPRMPITSPAF